ncbi:MAG: hypothetical protein AAF363_18170 [Bacteroidota bacterium]
MDSTEQKILNGYLGLIQSLTPTMKLSLIEHLKDSMKTAKKEESQMEEAFDSWYSNESAEELIETIRSSRMTDRQIKEF